MFPVDRYTPHGYLDNPAHGWKIGPGGVFRSSPAIGMGWHYPAFVGAYNYTFIYRLNLQLGFKLADGSRLLDPEDFQRAGIALYCDYHSKNLLRYVFQTPDHLKVSASFFLPDDTGDLLACLVRFENLSSQDENRVHFSAYLDYERDLNKSLTWGSELFQVVRKSNGAGYSAPNLPALPDQINYPHWGVTLGVFQEGETFHLMQARLVPRKEYEGTVSDKARQGHAHHESKRLREMYAKTDAGTRPAHLLEMLDNFVFLEAGESVEYLQIIGRGQTEIQAVQKVQPYFVNLGEKAKLALSEREAQDAAFWESAPQLGGDWPDHIRRGVVYDLETLRTLVRRPMLLYKNPWDAMQIQVPRTVLAEAAIDMLIFSYADPEAAKAVLYGTFADAPEPNVPCSREDGSYNMVAADGTPCGTAPEWCFPFHCINLVYRRTGDKDWLGRLYPLLENFLQFWTTYRQDSAGRPFYKCSWEAGQDNSPRFGIKDDPSGGAALTEHIWPVDLQAAMAQSCALMVEWARELGQTDSAEKWQTEASRHKAQMSRLWHKGWFHDYDTQADGFTEVLDTMQLAPLLCGVATPEQVAALQNLLADPPKHGQIFHPLMWPSIAFCLIEACSEAERYDLAARHSWAALDPVYRWLDSNPATVDGEAGGLPGVSREYWPQVVSPQANPPRGGGGAEVYGWGCLGTLLLYRYIIGFREEDSTGEQIVFSLRPDLPAALLQPGKTYTAGPFRHLTARISLIYRPTGTANELQIGLSLSLPQAAHLRVTDENGQTLHQSDTPADTHQVILRSNNGTNLRFLVG